MSVLPVHLLGSPPLRQRSTEVGTPDDSVRQLVQDLIDTMRAYRGVGIAANQVGITRRVAIVQASEQEEPLILIDPKILETEDEATDEEGCLSIPEIYADVTRPARVVVETTTLDGKRIQVAASDLKARAIQHEIDHLDGIIFFDRLSALKRDMALRKIRKLQREGTW